MTLVLKFAALLVIVALTYFLYAPHDSVRTWIGIAAVLFVGLMSFTKPFWLIGRGEVPGFLPMLSVMLFLGPVVVAQVWPHGPHVHGFAARIHELIPKDALADLVVGFIIAIWVWLPFGSYTLIDYLVSRRSRN